jgi:hypothetical protein
VFNLNIPGDLMKIVLGHDVGTVVDNQARESVHA